MKCRDKDGDVIISLSVCMCVFQAFREEIAPLKKDVRAVNDLAGQLTPLDVQLSSTTNRQLDNLNMRWKLLQVPLLTLPLSFPVLLHILLISLSFLIHSLPVLFLSCLVLFLSRRSSAYSLVFSFPSFFFFHLLSVFFTIYFILFSLPFLFLSVLFFIFPLHAPIIFLFPISFPFLLLSSSSSFMQVPCVVLSFVISFHSLSFPVQSGPVRSCPVPVMQVF